MTEKDEPRPTPAADGPAPAGRPEPAPTPLAAAAPPEPALPETEANPPPPPVQPPRSARARIEPERPARPTRPSRPERRPRRASTREWVAFGSGFLSFLMVVGVGAVLALAAARHMFEQPGPLREDTIVIIPRGSSLAQTAESLAARGVVTDAQFFTWGVVLSGRRQALKAGEYQFPRQASMRQVLDILASGRVVQHAITLPEGLTSLQIVQRLRDMEILSGEVREVPPEGSLLPETYLVPRGFERAEILRRMQQDQQRVLNEIWNRRRPDLPVRTPQELVTLASIVEKETGKAEERARVAAVFVNRLNQRMRLQSDPTIIYGIVGGQGTLGRPIQRGDIDRPTPYNTYTIPALPPGPIANPGRAALEAAARPARTRELYFVADGTGGHAFSETVEEHNRAVARWREIERARGAQPSSTLDVPPPAPAGASGARPPAPSAPRPPAQPQQQPQRPPARTTP